MTEPGGCMSIQSEKNIDGALMTEVGGNGMVAPAPHNHAILPHTHVITVPSHWHYFQNLPLTLTPSPEGVRDTMITNGINTNTRVVAAMPRSSFGLGFNQEIWDEMIRPKMNKCINLYVSQKGFSNANII